MKNALLLLCLLFSTILSAQSTLEEQISSKLVNLHQVSYGNENFEGFDQIKQAIGDAEIVMLGEQSHGEGTTYETKIKLIKYLHQEMGFEILAFESGFYECHKAWKLIEEGHDVRDALGRSIFDLWSVVEEFKPLVYYIEKELKNGTPLMISGFDNQLLDKLGTNYFVKDLTSYINSFQEAAVYGEELEELQKIFNHIKNGDLKRIKKKEAIATIAFLNKIEVLIKAKQVNDLSSFWLQSVKNLKSFISDLKLDTDYRDELMSDNLIWLKEKYPNKKIICWGATSHFLYNSSEIRMKSKAMQVLAANYYKDHTMMGDYIKEKYGDKVYTIGFTAYEGDYGLSGGKAINPPLENSLELLIGNAAADNYFLPLKGLSLEGYLSRPLGNFYMKTDISKVMDGVIFNRKMIRPYFDWDFYAYLNPDYKYLTRKIDRFKKNQTIRRRAENQNIRP